MFLLSVFVSRAARVPVRRRKMRVAGNEEEWCIRDL